MVSGLLALTTEAIAEETRPLKLLIIRLLQGLLQVSFSYHSFASRSIVIIIITNIIILVNLYIFYLLKDFNIKQTGVRQMI